jgi:hypothetical protein
MLGGQLLERLPVHALRFCSWRRVEDAHRPARRRRILSARPASRLQVETLQKAGTFLSISRRCTETATSGLWAVASLLDTPAPRLAWRRFPAVVRYPSRTRDALTLARGLADDAQRGPLARRVRRVPWCQRIRSRHSSAPLMGCSSRQPRQRRRSG